ncbi:MAG: bile acid:sodium symporter family protein [Atopobiaceae bacterium]|nr:bile acid:sodium symporter family protein [Atopobiaceae bacterium]
MERWQQFGAFFGRHMAVFVPLCVVVGILFPDVLGLAKPSVPLLFALMTVQGSLSNTVRGLFDLLKHPRPLFVILLITVVIMPVFARVAGGVFFGHNIAVLCGLVVECSIPIAVASIMWNTTYGGNMSLALALVLVSTLISPITIPASAELLLGQSVAVDVLGMMRDMAVQIAVPALIGVGINEFTHGWGQRAAAPVTAPASKLLLLSIILINSTTIAPFIRSFKLEYLGVAAFVFVLVVLGFVSGVLISRAFGFEMADTLTATFGCGLRNTSSGVVIASQFFPAEAMVPVIMVTMFQQTFAAIVGKLIVEHLGKKTNRP